MSQHSLTADFAAELRHLSTLPLDPAAHEMASLLITDGLSVAALGAGQAGPRLLAEAALATGGSPVATLIGHAAATSRAEAARANGAAMHVLDYEPMWNPANHALSTSLPAVLALAEGDTRPELGARILKALAMGIEAQGRLRLASGQYEPGELVFHPPGAVGPIGSAVASGIFLGLDDKQLTHAIGIAASRCGTVLVNAGSMTKALHCGQAAAAGVECALLAQKGFTADADALAGPRGYGHAFYREGFKPERLFKQNEPLHIAVPGPAFKLYPSQYGTHFVIAAALAARAQLPAGAAIQRVTIVCPLMPYVDRPAPVTGLAGKFSFQYTAAAAILDGTVNVASFTDARRFAPDMAALLPKIVLAPEPGREGRFDRMRLEVLVDLADGTRVEGRCDGPPGIWGRPPAPAQLREKAESCLGAAFGTDHAGHILDLLRDIGDIDHARFKALMSALGRDVGAMPG